MDERQKYQAMSKTTALLQGRGYLVGEGVIGMAGRSQWPVAYPNGTMVGYLMIDNPYHLFLLSGETVEACNVPDQRPAVPAQAANPYLRGPQAPTGRTSHHAQMNPHMRPQRQAPPPVTPSNYQFNSYTGAWEPTVPPMQYGHGQPQEVYPYLQGSQAPPAQMESHMSSQRQVPPSVPPARPQFNPYTRAWETEASPMQYGYRQPQPATSSLGHNYQPRHRRPDARQNLPSQTRAPSVYGPDQSNQQTDSRRPTVRPSHPQARTGQGNPRASTRGPTQGPVSQPSVPKQRQPVHTPVSGSGQPNLDTRTTNPTGAKPTRARWQSGLRGALAAWPVALVTTSGISREINAWAPGRQKVFSGYLGVLRLVSREDEELSNALAHLLTKASAVTELFRVENIFGSGTVFVSSDGSSHPFNPSTWPILTRAALKAYSGNGWQVDDKTGCIHVNEELDKAKFVTSRFYNKLRQEVCYAYTCNTLKSSAKEISMDDLIYDFEEEQKVADSFSKLGYPVLSPSLPKPETGLVLGDRNSKLIMEVDGKPWYLGVAQFNTDGKVKVTESFKDPRAENRHYLIAMGAASMGSMIPKGTQYHPKTKVDMAAIPGRAVNGIRLDKIFYEYGELCLQTNGLARTADSFDQARMWTLTREVDDPSKECTLSILDIGVRAPSTPFRDIGFVNHPEPAYNEAVANIKTVRCFVALVPDVLDSDLQSTGPLINVVNLQDIHPVNGELHIIYLIHRKGKYYTHHIYDNVKLVDVRISLDLEYDRRGDDEWEANRKEAERDHFVNSFQTIVSRDEPRQNESEFGPMDEVNQEYGCSRSVNGENQLVRAIRGFYNEFWKRVIDPMRAKEPEQREMFKRWQPFYSHDYKERHYLTEPLSNFKRHEVHVVRVADYLRECDRTARNTITGSSASTTSRKFLSGVGSVEQAFIGSCRVLLESTMIQVVVPDVRVKCVIYDFEGVANQGTRYYDADSERQAMAYFRQTLDLGLRKGEKIAERLFFPQYVGFSELQGAKCRKKVADREKDIKDGICKGYKWKEGNEVVTMDFAGSITERWFYFVNSVDTEDKVKVGVANLPFNCRAATVHCRSLCEVYLFRGVDSKDWTPLKQWDADLNSAESESSKYQIYGNVWDNEPGRQQVVGIVGGQSKLQVAESSVFLSGDKKMHSVVFFNNVHYEDIARQHKHIPGNMKRVLSVGLCQTGAYSAKATLNRDLNHHVRLLGTPVMDLCKGYPVQGFYRLRRLDCEKVTDSLAHTVENRTNKILSVTKDKRKAVVIPESGNDATGGNPADDQSDNQQITGEPQNEENQPQMSTVAVALSSLSTILAASILSQFH